MIKVNFKSMLMAFAIVSLGFISCKEEQQIVPADKVALTSLIAECNILVNGSGVTNDYPVAAIDEFKAIIATAKQVGDKTDATQTQVDNVVTNLTAAKEAFFGKAFGAIPAANLLIGLTGDETVANGKITTKGKGLVAELKGTALPTFESGHKGKAIHFSGGNYLEIANYTRSDFEGKEVSVAVWLKPTKARSSNYILSYNCWHGFKFNLQDANKPFFSACVNTPGLVVQQDNGSEGIPLNAWSQCIITFSTITKKLNFYTNGQLVKEWTAAELGANMVTNGKIAPNAENFPLLIGTALTKAMATSNYWTRDWSLGGDPWIAGAGQFAGTPGTYPDVYFEGFIDELKVYNIALSEGQIGKLYKDEK